MQEPVNNSVDLERVDFDNEQASELNELANIIIQAYLEERESK